jgi:hypothetical protein
MPDKEYKHIDTCSQHSGLVTHIDNLYRLLDERRTQTDLKIATIEKETIMAKTEMDRRLEGMNEFRAQLEKQSNTFISRAELLLILDKRDSKIDGIESKLTPLFTYAAKDEGSKKWTDYIITVIISAIVFVVLHFIVLI